MLYHAIIIPQIKLRCFIDRHVDPDVLKVSDYILDICLRSKAAENHSIIQNIVFISEEKALIAAPFHKSLFYLFLVALVGVLVFCVVG